MNIKAANRGFTLIELLVVVLIIGILAAIAVPQYFRIVEKGRFAESTALVGAFKGAEERYLLKNNSYTSTLTNLDLSLPALKYFGSVSVLSPTATAYSITLTRIAPTVDPYGAYLVTYVGGSAGGTYACNVAACTNDLLP